MNNMREVDERLQRVTRIFNANYLINDHYNFQHFQYQSIDYRVLLERTADGKKLKIFMNRDGRPHSGFFRMTCQNALGCSDISRDIKRFILFNLDIFDET